MDLLAWQNLLFYIPIGFGLLMVFGMAMGIGHDADGDVDADVDHDLDIIHGMGGGHGGHDGSGDHDVEHSGFARAMSILGIGKVPLSMVLMVSSFVFGGTGIIMNVVLEPVLRTPWIYAWISLCVAFVVMVIVTGGVARFINRYMPTTETYTVTKRGLIGQIGTLVLKAGPDEGLVMVRDKQGSIHQVACRTQTDEIPKGSEVVLVDFDSEKNFYTVVRSDAA